MPNGTGTNLHTKKFRLSRPFTFFGSTSSISRSVSAFVMVNTVWSVSCLLFFYSRCLPRAQPFVKVGGVTCPTESASVDIPPLPFGFK